MASLAGKFLVARPTLRDKFFGQTVILMLQHGEEGAFGLILNRPAPVKDLPFPLFVGGPCKFQGLMMLHAHPDWLDEDERHEVCPGVFLGDADCVSRVSDTEDAELYRFRMFTGYAGWGPDQLEREMTEGSWAVSEATADEVFDTPTDEMWTRLAPPALPQPSLN